MVKDKSLSELRQERLQKELKKNIGRRKETSNLVKTSEEEKTKAFEKQEK